EDLERIEARMREIMVEQQAFVREEMPASDARTIFRDHPFKLQIIDDASTDPMSATSSAGAVRTYENPPSEPKENPPFSGRPGPARPAHRAPPGPRQAHAGRRRLLAG